MLSPKFPAILLSLLGCLTFSIPALADKGVDFSDSGGVLSGSKAGLSLSGSTLISVLNLGGGSPMTGDLGTVTFTTGSLNSGSLSMGGTFAAGGAFTIDGNGTGGLANGVLFSGSFARPVTWTLITLANGTHDYTLTGVVTGSMGGMDVSGVTVQLSVNTGKHYFDGSSELAGGDSTLFTSVPEPSTLSLFGTGSLALLGTLRGRVLNR